LYFTRNTAEGNQFCANAQILCMRIHAPERRKNGSVATSHVWQITSGVFIVV